MEMICSKCGRRLRKEDVVKYKEILFKPEEQRTILIRALCQFCGNVLGEKVIENE